MTYAELFSQIKGMVMEADVSDIQEHLAFQFNIEDEEAGGAFYIEVKEGQVFVEPYEYYDRDAMFICAPDVLFQIVEGKLDPVAAFTDKKLRVEGDIEKALRFKDIVEMKRKAEQNQKSAVRKQVDKAAEAIVKTVAKKAVNKKK